MYEDLVRRLNAYSAECERHGGITAEAADAIEELDTLLDGVSADNEALCETIEMLKKQVEILQKNVAYWQAQLTKSMCGETLAELEKLHWVSVTERLPSPEEEVLVYTNDQRIGVDKFFGTIFGLPTFSKKGAKRVTHWMPLPEQPKEET